MKIALDTNILVYAEGVNGYAMQQQAINFVNRLPKNSTYLSFQVLTELFSVLRKKKELSYRAAYDAVLNWRDDFLLIEPTAVIYSAGMDLAVRHEINIWDAIMIAAAYHANCTILLSEDMQDGYVWKGLTVVNPFAAKPHPLLASFLDEDT